MEIGNPSSQRNSLILIAMIVFIDVASIGPVVMTSVFGAYADKTGIYFPGAPFILASGLLMIAIGVVWRTLRRYGEDGDGQMDVDSPSTRNKKAL